MKRNLPLGGAIHTRVMMIEASTGIIASSSSSLIMHIYNIVNLLNSFYFPSYGTAAITSHHLSIKNALNNLPLSYLIVILFLHIFRLLTVISLIHVSVQCPRMGGSGHIIK